MEYKMYTTSDGTELYVIHSGAYTHTCIDYNFYERCGKNNAPNALVNKMLMQGCRKYPTSQAISMAADMEFGARIRNRVSKVGDVQESGFLIDVLTSENLIGGRKTLENVVSLLSQIVSRPLINGGTFSSEYFKVAKADLVMEIRAAKLSKGYVAKGNFMRAALGDTSFN